MDTVERLWEPPAGEQIVSLVRFQDHIIMATSSGLYRVIHLSPDEYRVVPVPLTKLPGMGAL